jgi:hypothetical protein
MAIRVLKTRTPSALTHLADDYLSNCRARGLSPRGEDQYVYSLYSVFLPWCEGEGINDLSQLDRRAVDRFTSELLARTTKAGQPLSKHTVATYIKADPPAPRLSEPGSEVVTAKPQLSRRGRPIRDVLTRAELASLNRQRPPSGTS